MKLTINFTNNWFRSYNSELYRVLVNDQPNIKSIDLYTNKIIIYYRV